MSLESREAKLVSQRDYEQLRRELKRISGIELGPEKISLVEARLTRRLHELGSISVEKYLREVIQNLDEQRLFINLMTTNLTEWFREPEHFEILKWQVLLRRKPNAEPLQLWLAACSTGEEVYSLAFACQSECDINYRILGSDIDTEVLHRAEQGIYREDRVRGHLSPALCMNFFERHQSNQVRIRRELLGPIKFRQFNLLSSQLNSPVQFHVIFLRNVLIYFDPATVQLVVRRIIRNLRRGGLLFIGHSETLGNSETVRSQLGLRTIAPAVFRKEEERD